MVPSGGTSHCSSNQSGMVGSQQWTIWSSGGGGCLITYGSTTAFSATWNNSGDFLARVGLNLGSNKTYDQFGTIAADFAETKSGNGGGYSSIGVYGWSVSPLVEWYVTEDSYNGLGTSGTKKGTFTIDGEGTYNVYQRMQNNQPSIQGTASFPQFISIRTSARTCGHISLTQALRRVEGFRHDARKDGRGKGPRRGRRRQRQDRFPDRERDGPIAQSGVCDAATAATARR